MRSADTPRSRRMARAISGSVRPAGETTWMARSVARIPWTSASASYIACWWADVAPERSVPSMSNSRRSWPTEALPLEGHSGAQQLREVGDHLRRRVHVPQRPEFDRRVHVPQRHRDQSGRDPGAAEVNRVGAGPRPPARGLNGEAHAGALSRLIEELEHAGVKRGPACENRARPECVLRDLAEFNSRLVGGEGHVDGDRDIRVLREGTRP